VVAAATGAAGGEEQETDRESHDTNDASHGRTAMTCMSSSPSSSSGGNTGDADGGGGGEGTVTGWPSGRKCRHRCNPRILRSNTETLFSVTLVTRSRLAMHHLKLIFQPWLWSQVICKQDANKLVNLHNIKRDEVVISPTAGSRSISRCPKVRPVREKRKQLMGVEIV
jgi:hypothetical protein